MIKWDEYEFAKMTDLKKRIDEIPGDGWWTTSGRDTFLSSAVDLLRKGWTEDEIIEFLETLYFAVAGEFGE